MTLNLFDNDKADGETDIPKPLADRMRPATFDQFAGHASLVAPGKPLRRLVETGNTPSLVFWGPPGCGKTTLARLIAGAASSAFVEISAVSAGVAQLRQAVETARREWKSNSRSTILFIDEIHRFSKVQQDAILPRVEDGTLTVIGSTTENPAFEVIPALRSRLRIFRLEQLGYDDILRLLEKAVADRERGLGAIKTGFQAGALERMAQISGGDARAALNLLEACVHAGAAGGGVKQVNLELVNELARDSSILYDKQGQEHFDHASAFQKSLRGSDPDAAIYWLAKMLKGGEDPRFIARRLIVTASEDVGLADPTALMIAIAASSAVDRIGLPEGRIVLAHATLHIATAPKSNSAYKAIDKALADIGKDAGLRVPDHLKDTSYKTAKKFGFGKGYKYPHDHPGHWVEQAYLPEGVKKGRYYAPSTQGREKTISERMDALEKKQK